MLLSAIQQLQIDADGLIPFLDNSRYRHHPILQFALKSSNRSNQPLLWPLFH